MNTLSSRLAGMAVLVTLALCLSSSARAQEGYVYADNNINGPNSVSAFSVGSTGILTEIPGSPFLTGGTGTADGLLASNRLVVHGSLLFVANVGSRDISEFFIDPFTGRLFLLSRTPTPDFSSPAGSGQTLNGISLAVTPNGKFLIAANADPAPTPLGGPPSPATLQVFAITPFGTLNPVGGEVQLLFFGAAGLKITPDGKYVLVADSDPGADAVEVFSIASDGSLLPVQQIPARLDPASDSAGISGLDMNCKGTLVYGAETNLFNELIVEGFTFSAGSLSYLMPSSLTALLVDTSLNGSSGALLSRDDQTLFVTNEQGSTISVFHVNNADGSLTPILGSPFPMKSRGIPQNPSLPDHYPWHPTNMTTDEDGKFLFVTASNPPLVPSGPGVGTTNTISVFQIRLNGALTEITGSPFITGDDDATTQNGRLDSIAAWPPKTCRQY